MQAANEPKPIMVIEVMDDRGVLRQKRLVARALPMREAMEWLKEAEAIEAAVKGAKPAPRPVVGGEEFAPFSRDDAPGRSMLDTPEDALLAMAAFVAGYGADWPIETILTQATGPQIMEAFYALKDLNDPLAVVRKREQAQQDRGLRMLEALGKTSPDGLARLVEKHSSGGPNATLSPSGESSASTPGES